MLEAITRLADLRLSVRYERRAERFMAYLRFAHTAWNAPRNVIFSKAQKNAKKAKKNTADISFDGGGVSDIIDY
jgi:hypothetical protein